MATNTKYSELIKKHQAALKKVSSPKTKAWWEKYMKGVISFRGVGIPQNRELLDAWRKKNKIEQWSLEAQFELALAFFEEPIAEDKLAGILYLQNYLCGEMPWETMLKGFEGIYSKKLIFDWNICDWFCVRVLCPLVQNNTLKCAAKITSWKNDDYLWKARSSLVPFVGVASDSKYYPYIQKASVALIKREERFAKTAVGWILRDISKFDEKFVTSFINSNIDSFSKESLGNALKYFDDAVKRSFIKKLSN